MFILQLVHMVKVPQNDLLSSKLISVLAVQCCQIFLYSKVPRAVNWNTGTLRQDYTRLYFCRIFVDFFFFFFFLYPFAPACWREASNRGVKCHSTEGLNRLSRSSQGGRTMKGEYLIAFKCSAPQWWQLAPQLDKNTELYLHRLFSMPWCLATAGLFC